MKEAIANAGVFNIMIIFIVLLLAFFVGSLGYSKAFKVKNRIIDEIEKDEDYTWDGEDSTQDRIEQWLGTVGYRMNTGLIANECEDESFNGTTVKAISSGNNYQYCVYKFDTCEGVLTDSRKCSVHYRVVSYMYFDVPIISELIRIPVKGETKNFVTIKS